MREEAVWGAWESRLNVEMESRELMGEKSKMKLWTVRVPDGLTQWVWDAC